jgi:hypothetical protein
MSWSGSSSIEQARVLGSYSHSFLCSCSRRLPEPTVPVGMRTRTNHMVEAGKHKTYSEMLSGCNTISRPKRVEAPTSNGTLSAETRAYEIRFPGGNNSPLFLQLHRYQTAHYRPALISYVGLFYIARTLQWSSRDGEQGGLRAEKRPKEDRYSRGRKLRQSSERTSSSQASMFHASPTSRDLILDLILQVDGVRLINHVAPAVLVVTGRPLVSHIWGQCA